MWSLWLSPSPQSTATRTLSSLIASLPGPRFSPHATLLGLAPKGTSLEEVMQRVEEAVNAWRKQWNAKLGDGLTVNFKDVRTGSEYFRCVLVALEGE